MHICVATGLDDSSETLLGNTHEGMRVGCRVHGIDGNTNTAVGSVLEADGERNTRGELTVKLRFSGASTNGTPGDYWRDAVQPTYLDGRRKTHGQR